MDQPIRTNPSKRTTVLPPYNERPYSERELCNLDKIYRCYGSAMRYMLLDNGSECVGGDVIVYDIGVER